MTNCACDTFNSASVVTALNATNSLSGYAANIRNTGTGPAMYISCTSGYAGDAVQVQACSSNGAALYFANTCTTGGNGIYGCNSSTGVGVWGRNLTNAGIGIYGTSEIGTGIKGETYVSGSQSGYAIHGLIQTGLHGAAIYGVCASTSSSNDSSAIYGRQYGGVNSYGVYGRNDGTGVGIYGYSAGNGEAVKAVTAGNGCAIYGSSAGGIGIKGESYTANAAIYGMNSGTAAGYGVYASTDKGYAVYALAGINCPNYGIYSYNGGSLSGSGGIKGHCVYGIGTAGQSTSGIGVSGVSFGSIGVAGTSNEDCGVYGIGLTLGCYGYASGGSSLYAGIKGVGANGAFAGRFVGNVDIQGELTKSSGTFSIDHPLDPENKILNHSFVESPEMLNVYRGRATFDTDGKASVCLPDYFEALNTVFEYTLTAVGSPMPSLYISKEVENNFFEIAGGTPGFQVSWTVTGARQDAWAKAHPVIVEVDKKKEEKGFFLSPEVHGKSEDKRIHSRQSKAHNDMLTYKGEDPIIISNKISAGRP